eukprot:12884161-Prorocentrum_lima.AAC.1
MKAYTENISTATTWAQRAVNAYAARKNYTLFSMDISAAFLKGVTFQEIASETGDNLLSVQFDIPPAN